MSTLDVFQASRSQALGLDSSGTSSYLPKTFTAQRQAILSAPSRDLPRPTVTAGNQPQQNQIKIGSLTLNVPSAITDLTDRAKKNLQSLLAPAPKIEPVKFPDGFEIKVVEPKPIDIKKFDLSPAQESSSAKLTPEAQKQAQDNAKKIAEKFKPIRDVVDEKASALNKVLINEGNRIKRDINDLARRGVVSGAGQVAPREEYMTEEEYQKAVDRAIQFSKNPTVMDRISKNLGAISTGVASTLTLGKLAPDATVIESMSGEQRAFYTAGELLPIAKLVASPSGLRMLAKFVAVDVAISTALQALTGKSKVSELLPEGTSPVLTNTVDILEFIAKAYIAHGIKPGAWRDKMTKATIEKYNLPREVNISAAQLRDIHQTGKLTTAEEKQLVRSLQLSSKEYTNLIKSKQDITIKVPGEKVISMVDKPWWATVKSFLGLSPSEATVSVSSLGQPTQAPRIAGLLPAGEYTPTEVQSAVIGSAIEDSTVGKALLKASVEAQKLGQNISIEPPKLRNANKEFNQANTKKITEQTLSGDREQYRLDTAEKIQKNASVTALGTTDPEAEVKVFRWTKEAQQIEPGQYVALVEQALEKYKLRNPDPAFSVVESTVKVKDLVGGGGLKVEAIYAPKDAIAPAPEKVPAEVTRKEIKEPKQKFVPTIGIPKLAQGVRRNAIKNKLTYGFDKTFLDLPEYDRVNVKDQATKATELIMNDPERAFRIAMGRENPPGDILPESVFVAMEKYAIETRNVDVMRELATRSELTMQATGMGQRIRMLAERDTDSPVKAIRDVQDARRKAIEKKSKSVKEATKKVVKEIKEKIKTPDKNDWDSFIKSIEC